MRMKKHVILLTISFTLMLSTASFAEWRKVTETAKATFYINLDRFRKVDGFVYYLTLMDYLEPGPYGDLSTKFFTQGDCRSFRYKYLNYFFHKEPMGGGTGRSIVPKGEVATWQYPLSDGPDELILKIVCNQIIMR